MTGTREEWLGARLELLEAEKELTRRSVERSSRAGTCFALGALICMTAGTILQKGINQSPLQVLPLQYATSLLRLVFRKPVADPRPKK